MDAARRWRGLVRGRMGEVARLDSTRAGTGGAYWDPRARRYAASTAKTVEGDPFLAKVRRVVGRRTTVLDVGAGTGRFALALAPRAAEVVAVDPSAGMLGELRRQARRQQITNVRCIQSRWEDAESPVADVAICSYVLPVIPDPAPFLHKLDRSTRRRVFLYLGAFSADALFDPLWRHFHGRSRRPGATYLDLVAVMEELALPPTVEVVEVPAGSRFPSLAAAVKDYRNYLLLEDTAEIRKELRGLLGHWLVREGDTWRLPAKTLPAAVLSWTPAGPEAQR